MVPDRKGPAVPERTAPESPTADARPRLPRVVHDHLGTQLRAAYAAIVTEPPRTVLDLLVRLESALADQPASTFRQDLLGVLPALRGFALSLTTSVVHADDLVQETLLKAWQNQHRFAPGTNMKAWLFTILRNQFYTQHRKLRREVEDVDGAAATQMMALPDQEDGVALRDVWKRLGQLPASQREALLLVATQGLTYEAAAALMGVQVGTVKSRVSRARSALAEALGHEADRARGASGPH
ncbi:sigma-70 family RNA polymerase sigma factor [Methylobacterium sp. JK268]